VRSVPVVVGPLTPMKMWRNAVGWCCHRRNASPSPAQLLLIVDVRPKLNAVANQTQGKGYETVGPGTNYPFACLHFMSGTHSVFQRVRCLCPLTLFSMVCCDPQNTSAQHPCDAQVVGNAATGIASVSGGRCCGHSVHVGGWCRRGQRQWNFSREERSHAK
jgi:hypothetical protein